jgi:hypothetical protein
LEEWQSSSSRNFINCGMGSHCNSLWVVESLADSNSHIVFICQLIRMIVLFGLTDWRARRSALKDTGDGGWGFWRLL